MQKINRHDEEEQTGASSSSNLDLTTEQRRTISMMASFGIPQSEIARYVGISINKLRKRFRNEIRRAPHDVNNNVLASLVEMATTRHNTAAAIFWAKTRCAFRPGGAPYENAPGVIRELAKSGKTRDDDDGKEEYYDTGEGVKFGVYNNDGEPNFDD